MKYNFKKTTIIYYILIIIIVVLIIYFLSSTTSKTNETKKEPFTQYFRKIYRPCVRKIRKMSDNAFNPIKSRINLYFKKIGII